MTEPDVPIVAKEVLLDVHVPPDTPSVRVMLPDTHTDVKPNMVPDEGAAFIVKTFVA